MRTAHLGSEREALFPNESPTSTRSQLIQAAIPGLSELAAGANLAQLAASALLLSQLFCEEAGQVSQALADRPLYTEVAEDTDIAAELASLETIMRFNDRNLTSTESALIETVSIYDALICERDCAIKAASVLADSDGTGGIGGTGDRSVSGDPDVLHWMAGDFTADGVSVALTASMHRAFRLVDTG